MVGFLRLVFFIIYLYLLKPNSIKMKLLQVIALSILLFSCSKDDKCAEEKAKIKANYDAQIQAEYENTPIDYSKISLLTQERDNRVAKACD